MASSIESGSACNARAGIKIPCALVGAELPPTEAGAMVGIRNDSGQTITIYPYNTSSTINAAATSVTLATAKSMILFAPSATTWASVTSA